MLSSCIPDTRDRSRIVHTHADMVRPRVFAIASGTRTAMISMGYASIPLSRWRAGRRLRQIWATPSLRCDKPSGPSEGAPNSRIYPLLMWYATCVSLRVSRVDDATSMLLLFSNRQGNRLSQSVLLVKRSRRKSLNHTSPDNSCSDADRES